MTGWDRGELTCWRPTTVDDVRDCVQHARRHSLALYPISTGLNWGYGSGAPPEAGSVLLDLSGMNRIRNAAQISPLRSVAVIEPGVTQRQLHDFLRESHPGLSFNVTGSSIDTSILGNALDRGVGYLGPRREDVFGLEVVSGRGEVLQTGFRRLGEGSPLAHTHPYGLGPMLDGLFFQSNFGIVTSACLKLVPRPQRSVAVSLALRDSARLAEFLNGLAMLKRLGVISGVTHVGNQARTRASMMSGISEYLNSSCAIGASDLVAEAERALATAAPFEWTSLGGVAGSSGQVKAAVAEIRRVLGEIARVMVVDDEKLALGFRLLHPMRKVWPWARANAAAIAAIRPLQGLADGRPTDAAIANLLWRFGQPQAAARDLDASNCGLLFINPALPMDGEAVVAIVARMTSMAAELGHELYVTLNIETTTSFVAVANLLFDRSDAAAVKGAHACARALWHYLRSQGLEVYRARADMMEELVDPADPFWRTAWELKSVFDPDNVIAPGRYNLPRAPLA
ncbi:MULTISPECIES: FAD-binding oxidoreductase [unclassified Roseateles]|uniref:FAD-binding oxidoreductase n=1 Tax=unclassified Roseateles TaxID=2626991 RepID=UPI0021010F7E|nr:MULTISPECIES: FAD-dependent oxidoreductase [unclassified Roseateles]